MFTLCDWTGNDSSLHSLIVSSKTDFHCLLRREHVAPSPTNSACVILCYANERSFGDSSETTKRLSHAELLLDLHNSVTGFVCGWHNKRRVIAHLSQHPFPALWNNWINFLVRHSSVRKRQQQSAPQRDESTLTRTRWLLGILGETARISFWARRLFMRINNVKCWMSFTTHRIIAAQNGLCTNEAEDYGDKA